MFDGPEAIWIIGGCLLLASVILVTVIGLALSDHFDRDGEVARKQKEIYCPVCGYYCLGKGGFGCIDKTSMVHNSAINRDITELDSPLSQKCCEGGPQWGHSWNCKKLP